MGPTALILGEVITLLAVTVFTQHAGASCSAVSGVSEITAEFKPGVITLDGSQKDWINVRESRFLLRRALGPPEDFPEGTGEMILKAVHDGQNLFMLVQIPGHFLWSSDSAESAPSVSLMFGVGSNATLQNMGGCPLPPTKCSPSSCRGHEVDIVQFKINSAIPGRIYGTNEADELLSSGHDRVGELNDLFGWNQHCKYFDAIPKDYHIPKDLKLGVGTRNDWTGAWGHSSINTTFGLLWEDAPFGNLADDGSFVFEFSRPLRTNDKFNQDVQFEIGSSHRFGAAAWYPENEVPWSSSLHYIISCDWVSLKLEHGVALPKVTSFDHKEDYGFLDIVSVTISSVSLFAVTAIALAYFWQTRKGSDKFMKLQESDDL